MWWRSYSIAAVGALAAGEVLGLRSGDPHGPFTPNVRAWLGVKPARPHRLAATGALAGLAAAAVTHLATEWPRHHPWVRP